MSADFLVRIARITWLPDKVTRRYGRWCDLTHSRIHARTHARTHICLHTTVASPLRNDAKLVQSNVHSREIRSWFLKFSPVSVQWFTLRQCGPMCEIIMHKRHGNWRRRFAIAQRWRAVRTSAGERVDARSDASDAERWRPATRSRVCHRVMFFCVH